MKVGFLRSPASIEEADDLLASLEKNGCQRIFVGSSMISPDHDGVLSALTHRLAKGDTLIVSTFETVAGSLPQFVEFVAALCRRGVVFVSIKENFNTARTSRGPALATVIEQLAHTRFSADGPTAAKPFHLHSRAGRPRLLSEDDAHRARLLVFEHGRSVKGVASEMGVSRATLYRYLDEARAELPA